MEMAGKVCVVTGASSGIGRRTALDLAAAGAVVCAAARREERLRSLVDELAGDSHTYVVTDVSDRANVKALAEHVRERYGRCDVLVNNAGLNSNRPFDGSEAADEVERVMRTNFLGAVYCTAELLDLLEGSAPSSVVNVASMAGRIVAPGQGAYCASKFALVGWSEALYFELSERDVWVSCVEPGFIPTEGFPQDDLVGDPVLRFALGSVEGVSRAIRDAIRKRKMERVEPRWYYLLQIPRLLSPPMYRFVQRRFVGPRAQRRRTP
jgi:NAD(P)-dependent dehydrogenase (short-subunit alcohol dehydrogenase family)